GVILGGFLVLWRFVLQRERFSRIESSVDVTQPEKLPDNRLLVELGAIVTNRGQVRHWLKAFRFDLHYLPAGFSPMEGDERINFQTLFKALIKHAIGFQPHRSRFS